MLLEQTHYPLQNDYKPTIIQFSGREWVTKQKWNNWQKEEFDGMYHKDFLNMWYDTGAVQVREDGELNLFTRENPKIIDGHNIPYGVGLISSIDNFRFGYFSLEVMLPKVPNIWSAFWTMSPSSYPPEIDIVESWSGKNGKYSKYPLWLPFVKRNITTNVHWGVHHQGTHPSFGSEKHYVLNPTCRFVKYEMYWYKDHISILYDGGLVKEIRDKEILKWLDADMWFIINTGVEGAYTGEDSVMRCRNFQYKKL